MPAKKRPTRKTQWLDLVLPATSANLGPGVRRGRRCPWIIPEDSARLADDFSIEATGRDPEICGQLENHLIVTTYREVLEAEGKPVLAARAPCG